MNTKGFTLIELMVVVGIIGVLATLSIYGLRESRLRADDASVESYATQIPAVIEVTGSGGYFTTYGDHWLDCTQGIFSENEDVAALIQAAEKTSADNAECGANEEDYAISFELKGRDGYEYCVDARGFKGIQISESGVGHSDSLWVCQP